MTEMDREGQFFKTTSGRKIDFIPGLFEFLQKARGKGFDPLETGKYFNEISINIAGGHSNIGYDKINKKYESAKIEKMSLWAYATRLIQVYRFMGMLNDTKVNFPFRKCLDIGCGFGIQPRIMKGLDLIDEAVGIDLYDRCSAFDEKFLIKQHRRVRYYKLMEKFQELSGKIPFLAQSDLRRAFLEKYPSPRVEMKNSCGEMVDDGIYKLKMVKKPHLDRYINGNIFEIDQKFDLITSYTSLQFFESKSIMRKISDLLEVGGVLYLLAVNWWHPGFNYGEHFPYANQRLKKEDYFRYLEKYQRQDLSAAKAYYTSYDPTHPTISDYIETANDNSLIVLNYKSFIRPEPFALNKRGINALGYAEFSNSMLNDVLEDIHQFRPDIRLNDILPFGYSMVFKKIDKKVKLDEERLEQIFNQLDFHYRPTNPVMKLFKKWVIKATGK